VVDVPDTLSDIDREELQRHVLRVLRVGQVVGAAALGAAVTVGAFVVQESLGSETPWAGIATATVTVGTAFTAQALSRVMRRRGRRAGLQRGYGMAVLGALVAALGAETGWLPVFLVGLFVYGSGQASNLLARYAATDLADPERRSSAMSSIVFASTFGAVLGPLLVGPAEDAGTAWFGLDQYTGPWLFSSVFFALALVNTAVRLRPDPLVVIGGLVESVDEVSPAVALRQSLTVIRASPRARLALTAMVVSHATMVAVMTMTPVHMKLHGHEDMSQFVVSVHIAGMYAFAPLVGRYADRHGRERSIMVGGWILVAATVIAGLSGDVEQLLFPALWLLGLGWNFGLIGGSSLLTESVPDGERVGVQGSADLMMSLCGGLAGFMSGFVRRAVGYHLLAGLATVLVGVLLATAIRARRDEVALVP
jgi:MFS family permease